jgi:hypothetical protein
MKLRKILSALIILLFTASFFGQNATPKRIRGRIIGYEWNTRLFVKTAKNKFLILYPAMPTMAPIPHSFLQQKKVWNFAVKPLKNCEVPFSPFRWSYPPVICDTGEIPFPESVQRRPEPNYPFLVITNEIYRNDFDSIGDDEILPCFAFNTEKTKPVLTEYSLNGVVLNENDVPYAEFPLEIGFEGENAPLFNLRTNDEGRFSIPVYQQFSYWLRSGLAKIAGQKDFKIVQIPKNKKVEFLRLKLE